MVIASNISWTVAGGCMPYMVIAQASFYGSIIYMHSIKQRAGLPPPFAKKHMFALYPHRVSRQPAPIVPLPPPMNNIPIERVLLLCRYASPVAVIAFDHTTKASLSNLDRQQIDARPSGVGKRSQRNLQATRMANQIRLLQSTYYRKFCHYFAPGGKFWQCTYIGFVRL